MIRSKTLRWRRLSVAHIGEMRIAYKNEIGSTKERGHWEDLGVDEIFCD